MSEISNVKVKLINIFLQSMICLPCLRNLSLSQSLKVLCWCFRSKALKLCFWQRSPLSIWNTFISAYGMQKGFRFLSFNINKHFQTVVNEKFLFTHLTWHLYRIPQLHTSQCASLHFLIYLIAQLIHLCTVSHCLNFNSSLSSVCVCVSMSPSVCVYVCVCVSLPRYVSQPSIVPWG